MMETHFCLDMRHTLSMSYIKRAIMRPQAAIEHSANLRIKQFKPVKTCCCATVFLVNQIQQYG